MVVNNNFEARHHIIHLIHGVIAVIIVVVIKAILGALFFFSPKLRPEIIVLTFVLTVIASYHYEKNLLIRFKEWLKEREKHKKR